LYALPDVDATDDDLQIMTIHKAKGLEFGTVIVPCLDSGPGGGDPDLLLFNEVVGTSGVLLAPIKATGSDDEPTYQYLGKLEREAERIDAARAKHRLHLMACVGLDDKGELKKPNKHTLLERAWPVAEAAFQELPLARPHALQPPPARIKTTRRLPDSFRMPPLPAAVRWDAPPEGREEDEIE